MEETGLERPGSRGGLPSFVKFLLFLGVVAVAIATLTRFKAIQRSANSGLYGIRVPRYGTSDPLLQQAFATNDVDAIKRRLSQIPRSEIRRNVVDILANGPTAKSLDAILSAGWDPHGSRRDDGPLIGAVSRGDVQVIGVLLRHGVSPNSTGPGGQPPVLFEAVRGPAGQPSPNSAATVLCLLDHGAKPDIEYKPAKPMPDYPSTTRPLIEAAKTANYDAMKVLLEHGADPNWTPPGGAPAIIAAGGSLDTPRLTAILLEHGARADATGTLRRLLSEWRFETITAPALYFDAEDGDAQSVKVLLSHGADPYVKASNGKTAIEAARGDALTYFRSHANTQSNRDYRIIHR